MRAYACVRAQTREDIHSHACPALVDGLVSFFVEWWTGWRGAWGDQEQQQGGEEEEEEEEGRGEEESG